MKRNINYYLQEWKNDLARRVLLLRGARQVGKTYSIQKLGSSFEQYVEVNFEQDKPVQEFFKGSLDPAAICQRLGAYFDRSIIPGKTLLFFDEIQACPDALRSLRFFHEKLPLLHVAAAGSLLEFVLSEIPSFGVGRISPVTLYPMNFGEFLDATGSEALHDMVKGSSTEQPMDPVLHKKLLETFRLYNLIGGMPAVVSSFVENGDIKTCQLLMDELISTIQMDFAKYGKNIPSIRLKEVMDAVTLQTGGKFIFSKIGDDISSRQGKEALALLVKAGLVHKVFHTSASGIPLGAQCNMRKFKCLFFDLGLHQRMQGLDMSLHLTQSDVDMINKGDLAELFVGLELISGSNPRTPAQLYYWHREARSSNAEIDYVIQSGADILPIEVKAGTKGQMQSMFLFLKQKKLKRGIRVSQENFGRYGQIETIPIYAASQLASGFLPVADAHDYGGQDDHCEPPQHDVDGSLA